MEHIVALFEHLPFISFVRSELQAYAFLSAIHILSLAVLVGSILPLDLGLIGFKPFSWAASQSVLHKMALLGFLGAAFSGVYLVGVEPRDYISNDAFLFKLSLIALAGLNVLYVFFKPTQSFRLKFHAGLSLVLWVLVLFSGRWIGFV